MNSNAALHFNYSNEQARSRRPSSARARLAVLLGLAVIIFSAAAAARAGTVTGSIFDERNADGIRQPSESVFSGVTVNVFNAGGNGQIGGGDDFLAGSDLTHGIPAAYTVAGLPAGLYYIQVINANPDGNIFSPLDQGGDDAVDSDVNPATGLSAVFALGAASTVTLDAGLIGCRIRTASGATLADIQSAVSNFRTDLGGGLVAGPNGSFGGLRREISWESVPASAAAPNAFPFDFFNTVSPRGIYLLETGTQVSGAAADNGAGQPAAPRFGHIQPSYTANFQAFSGERLFTPIGDNQFEIVFAIPGQNVQGLTSGFGAVFTDVETAGATTIEYFNHNGASLGKKVVPTSPNGGLSFYGLDFEVPSGNKIISKVRITLGTFSLGAVEGAQDLVVMDDFIYGEPNPNRNLVVKISDTPDPVVAGNNLSYNITFTNAGTADLQNVTLSDFVGNSKTFVSMTQNTGPAFVLNTPPLGGTGLVTGTLGTLPAGVSATFTLVVKIPSNYPVTQTNNTVEGDSNPKDIIHNDNFDGVTTDVIKQVDLSVIKTASPTAPAGGNITYNLAVSNAGPSDDQGVSLVDSLPPDTTFVSFTQNSGPAFILNTPPVNTNGLVSAASPSFAAGASATFTLVAKVAPATALGTIINNTATFSSAILDTNPGNNSSQAMTTVVLPALSVNDVSIAEGNAGSSNAVFTVSLNAPSTSVVKVSYVSSNGTAVSPGDYQSVGGTLTFTPGQTTREVLVPINGDTFVEANETFFINLSNPTNATVADPQGLGTINDDDASGVFQFSASSMNVSEAAGSAIVTITRTGDTSGVASVRFETSDLTARQRTDYTFESGTVQFAPNQTSRDINIPIVNDVFLEGNDTFQITLSNASGNFAVGTPGAIVVTIISDDPGGAPNPIDDAGFFVRQQYLDFLGREPDAQGLAFWTNNITSCGANVNCVAAKRIDTSAAFFLSIEFQETSGNVIRTQRVAFGGQSNDPLGRVPYLQFMRDSRQVGQGVIFGQPGADVLLEANKQGYAYQTVNNDAFLARFPIAPAAAYVDALFASAGVTPTVAERNAAISAFGAGGTIGRVAALRSVADSASLRQAEFSPSFVLSQYYGYLRRNPTDAPDFNDAGYQFWLNKLNTFNGDFRAADMVKAFITASEYRQRFGP